VQSNGTLQRWTQEMLDQFSTSVATVIVASNERMARLEQSQIASNERMTRLEETVQATEAQVQATSRDVAHLVDTQGQFREVLGIVKAD
jgi:hypothetical protein